MKKSKSKVRFSYYLVCLSVRIVTYLFYHPKFIGLKKVENIESAIIAPNHISLTDPPIIGSFFRKEITAIAKSELFKNKLVGRFLRFVNVIPIRRAVFDKKALSVAEDRFRNGYNILIFPEGTRKSSKPKAGVAVLAYNTQAKVVPVNIKNSNKFWSCFFFLKRLEIVYGDPIDLTEYYRKDESKENYREITNVIYERILSLGKNNQIS